jgi:hypothetical protein
VVGFLSAAALTLAGTAVLGVLLLFVLHRGFSPSAFMPSQWTLVPPWTGGVRRYLLLLEEWDVSFLIVVPLLLGVPGRIRDFAARALLLPLAFACALPISWSGRLWWAGLQDQIVHDMRSSDASTRESAHGWAGILLRRFPHQARWVTLAEDCARAAYASGDHAAARSWYREIVRRFSGSNQWFWQVSRARAALESGRFGQPAAGPRLEIPMVDYEGYLTCNWMALLSVIRYWEGPDVPESEVKIRLKQLSRSEDRILLSPLAGLADVDDAARSLGYDVLILPAGHVAVRALVSAGIPVVHQEYGFLKLIFGRDDSRSATRAYAFAKLSSRLRSEARMEVEEILVMAEEGHGQSRERLERIRLESYDEYGPAEWDPAALAFRGPLMAVVFPEGEDKAVASALDADLEELRRSSDGYLAALVGLAHLDHADPIQAVEWAKLGSDKTTDPLPLHVAHLARELWESRDQKVKSRLPLQDQLPPLRRLFRFFEQSENAGFLEAARRRFEADRDAGRLAWQVADKDYAQMHRSDAGDLEVMVGLMRSRVRVEPTHQAYWIALADVCEWAGDLPGMVEALEGALSSNPQAAPVRLRLAYGYVLLERLADAKRVFEKLDPEAVEHEADYSFCRGVLAEWEQDRETALEAYRAAAAMRTDRPIYHLRLGSLLLDLRRMGEARKALEWAAKIDAEGPVAGRALRLLTGLEGDTVD